MFCNYLKKLVAWKGIERENFTFGVKDEYSLKNRKQNKWKWLIYVEVASI